MVQNSPLTTAAVNAARVKYFRVPMYCTNMLPNVTYTAYVGGINIGPYCTPKGGSMGDPLVSDATGKLQFTYSLSIPYNTTFITNPNSQGGLLNTTRQITLVDPLGRVSITYLPVQMKSN